MNILRTVVYLCLPILAILTPIIVSATDDFVNEEKNMKNVDSIEAYLLEPKSTIYSFSPHEQHRIREQNVNHYSEYDEDSGADKSMYIRKKRSVEPNQDSINSLLEGTKETQAKPDRESAKATLSPLVSWNSDVPLELSTKFSYSDLEENVGETTTQIILSETTTETAAILDESGIERETATEFSDSTKGNLQETTIETESISTSTTEESHDSNPSVENKDDEKDEESSSQSSTQTTAATVEDGMMKVAMARVNKLSDQIREVLLTYRKVGVVQLPGQTFFPEPMTLQDFTNSFSIGTMTFKNMKIYGLSNFTVEHVNTDIDRMQAYVLLHMKRLVVLGNYTLATLFKGVSGPFNVTLLDVDSEGTAEVQVTPEGHLEATDSVMDMSTSEMKADFMNLGFLASLFQSMISTVGDAVFNRIKPQILEKVNVVIRKDINEKLKELSTKFINKVNPVDLAFSEGRRYVRAHGYDPYHVKDHTFLIGGIVFVNITNIWVEGLSRFHRAGNLTLSLNEGVIEIGVHVLTETLTGHFAWSGRTFGITKSGKTNFTVDHLQVRAIIFQSLDVRKKPQLHELDLELGWVKIKMDSPLTLNLMIEGIINAMPRLIRHIIVDTLEEPLKEKIQEILDKINVQNIVEENLPRLDSFGL